MARSAKKLSKQERINNIKRILSHTNEETALSITDIFERLMDMGFDENRKNVERVITDFVLDYPLSSIGSNPVRYYFDGEFKVNFELVFDEEQLQTIVLALQSLKQMSPDVIKRLCNEVENTLVSKLPRVLSREFEHLKSVTNAAPTALGEGSDIDQDVFKTVLQCLRKGKLFQCNYVNADLKEIPERIRTFAPLKLHFAGAPYLYVYDFDADKEIKLIRLSRVHGAVMTNLPVDRSVAKGIKLDYVFGGFGRGDEKIVHYEVTCSEEMARKFRENKLHPTQKIEVISRGTFKITFSVHDSTEIQRILAQYGDYIQDIKPSESYEKVKEIWKKGLKAS